MCKFIKPQIPESTSIDERRAIMFDALNALDMSDQVEKRNGLSYVSWAAALREFRSAYPSATIEVKKNPQTGLPYFSDPNVGIFVYVEVTADGLPFEVVMPVLDSKNRSMKEQPYTYQVWDDYKKAYVEKTVAAATSFDINRSILRAMTKAFGFHGLALYLYAGEDLPNSSEDPKQQQQTQQPVQTQQKPYDRFASIKTAINKASDVNALLSLYLDHQAEIDANPQIKALLTQRKQQLQMLTQNQ